MGVNVLITRYESSSPLNMPLPGVSELGLTPAKGIGVTSRTSAPPDGTMCAVRVGLADHLGWAVAVTSSENHQVVDRRRLELIEPGLPAAPIHHHGGAHALHRKGEPLDDRELADLVRTVRASVVRATSAALDELSGVAAEPIEFIALRDWPPDFPEDIAQKRQVPYEARADPIMYREVIAHLARGRGWAVHLYDAKRVEDEAASILGRRAHEVLHGPREILGAPWSKDHRMALAATIVSDAQV
jgi:hypothetical protein